MWTNEGKEKREKGKRKMRLCVCSNNMMANGEWTYTRRLLSTALYKEHKAYLTSLFCLQDAKKLWGLFIFFFYSIIIFKISKPIFKMSAWFLYNFKLEISSSKLLDSTICCSLVNFNQNCKPSPRLSILPTITKKTIFSMNQLHKEDSELNIQDKTVS